MKTLQLKNWTEGQPKENPVIRLKRILSTIVLTLTILAADEAVYRLTDPLGLIRLANNRAAFSEHLIPDEELGYILPQGHYEEAGLTITEDGSILVRNSVSDAECRLVFVGDSVTAAFPIGMDNSFPNIIAGRHEAEVKVWAMSAWKLSQIITTLKDAKDDFPVDSTLYVYLITDNAIGSPSSYTDMTHPNPYTGGFDLSGLAGLIKTTLHKNDNTNTFTQASSQPIVSDDLKNLKQMTKELNMLVIGFEGSESAKFMEGAGIDIKTIPQYQSRYSFADSHPSQEGHYELSDSLDTLIGPELSEVCDIEP